MATFIAPPTKTDGTTITNNQAGELEIKDGGVDFNHLKEFSAVRPQRQHLFVGAKDVSEVAGDSAYPLGISVHRQSPANWTTMGGAFLSWVWTFRNSGNGGLMQYNVNYETKRVFVRMFDAFETNWGPWLELTAIPVLQSGLSDLETEVNGLSNDLGEHDVATTDVHGIAAPDAIESEAGAQAKADVVQGSLDEHAGTDAGAATRGHVLRAANVAAVGGGGGTVDAEARQKINQVLDSLKNAGTMVEDP